MRSAFVAVAAVFGLATPQPTARGGDAAYRAEIDEWRRQRETRLRADGGWLTVAGLFWLKEGANRFGSGPGHDVVLPGHSAPAKAGVFELSGGKVVVRVEPGVAVTLEGKPVTETQLRSDVAGPPDVLALGRLTLQVIVRGGRHAIRLKDMDSKARGDFRGLTWFPVSEDLRVTARFVPHPASKRVAVPNVLGTVEEMASPGTAVFTLAGKELRLEPVLEDPEGKELFFIFRDQTAGKETYPGGRFLYTPLPKDGQVVLDFNKAYNPPCAFTAFATCPLPPKQNRLPLKIEAGEKYSGDH